MSVWEQQPLKRVSCACVIDRGEDSDLNHSVCPCMGEHLSSSSSSQVGQVLKALPKAGPHRETADSRIQDVLGCSLPRAGAQSEYPSGGSSIFSQSAVGEQSTPQSRKYGRAVGQDMW